MRSNLLIAILTLNLVLTTSCSDNVILNKSDIVKYDWLEVFITEDSIINGIHDLDNSRLDFDVITTSKTDYIYRIDSLAKLNDWNIMELSDLRIELEKSLIIYGETIQPVHIYISAIDDNLVHYTIE